MKMESIGILTGLRPINERDCVARVFTRDSGVWVGVMRGAAVAKKNRPMIGQYGNVVWNARLDSQLGTMHWDAEKNLAAVLMARPMELGLMNAAFDLINVMLPERESYAVLFDNTLRLMRNLANGITDAYLMWEMELLAQLGYAMDLSRCSGCGTTNDLNFVSPRTGRAVCDVCAAPYVDRLYRLPVTLDVTLGFLNAACVQQGVEIPVMRKMLKHV